MNDSLKLPIESIRHVEGKRAQLLNKLGIQTVEDLLLHLPYRYLDLTRVARIGDQFEGDITCSGTITSVKVKRPRPKLRITEVALTDDTGTVFGVWFNQPWVETVFRTGQHYAFAGTMVYEMGMRRMQNPHIQSLEADQDEPIGEVIALYHSTEGLAQGWIRRIVAEALEAASESEEVLPEELRARRGMRTYLQALHDVHRPASVADAQAARNRLAYQELFEMYLLNAARRYHNIARADGFVHRVDGPLVEQGKRELGVTLTKDQEQAVADILSDLHKPYPMQRLLLGDVGTGKTFVAVMAMFAVADSGTQVALMAPTEVLAKQYAQRIGPILDALNISWVLATSSLTSSERTEVRARIKKGEVTVAFGTHALIQADVEFENLTLAIIDEQHRFGVEQRKALRDKAQRAPDVLSMTATPIPRSLALTVYGDLDISTLRERPIKGAGVTTQLLSFARVAHAHDEVKRALDAGQQAFVLCALIEESTKLEVNAATDLAEELARDEYKDYRVALLHGALKSSEKDAVMEKFRCGAIDVLVSTTVIEVGVDIHSATRMVVYNAERFGLAQLHQLRGRVGRGTIPGKVWLISDAKGSVARERFKALCETDDGFALADIDLALRGAGDVAGTRQHGAATFKAADIVKDIRIIELARRDVTELFESDPDLKKPEHSALQRRLQTLQDGYEKWVSAG